jgi:anaerobic ribonucleoside-triphosphate reductase
MDEQAGRADDIDPAQRQRCEIYTRVMGYHRPVTEFNVGKQQEHRDRKHFTESKAQRLL